MFKRGITDFAYKVYDRELVVLEGDWLNGLHETLRLVSKIPSSKLANNKLFFMIKRLVLFFFSLSIFILSALDCMGSSQLKRAYKIPILLYVSIGYII